MALSVQRTEIDVPSTANCVYIQHRLLRSVMINKDIWEQYFKPIITNGSGNNTQVIIDNSVVLIKLGTQFDVYLYTDDQWRPGNFIIALVTDYPAPNETSIVKNALMEFFKILKNTQMQFSEYR